MGSREKSRVRRVLEILAGCIGALVTFAVALVAGVVLHLDVPVTRRLVVREVDRVLAGELAGDVRLESLHGLGLRCIEGARARVKDPDGFQVLFVDGVDVCVDTPTLVRSLLGEGPIAVTVSKAKVTYADVAIDAGPDGEVRLQRALAPKSPTPKPPSEEPGRGVRVEVQRAGLRHAWIHGVPAEGGVRVDADVDHLAAHALVDPRGTEASLDHLELVTRGLPRGIDPAGVFTGRFELSSAEGEKPIASVTFDGTVAGAATDIDAKLDRDRVDATIDAHDRGAAHVGAALGELALRDEVTLHAEAHGTLPKIDARLALTLGDAEIDVDADVATGDPTRIDASVAARRIDLSRIARGAPPSELGLDARGSVVLGEPLRVAISIDTLPGRIDQKRVPPISGRGRFTGDTAEAAVRIEEPSMPTRIHVAMAPEGGQRVVRARVRSAIPDLADVPFVGAVAGRGSLGLDSEARVGLGDKSLEGHVAVTGDRIDALAVAVSKVRTEADLSGTLEHPVVDAALRAEGLRSGSFGAEVVQARARVEPSSGQILVRGARVDVTRGSDTVAAGAALVRVAGESLRVEDGRIAGLGAMIEAELDHDARGTTARIVAPRVDLARAARIAGAEGAISRGELSLDVGVAMSEEHAKAALHTRVVDLAAREIDGAAIELDAALDDRDVRLDLDARLDAAGRLAIHSRRLRLGGRPTEPSSWKEAAGRLFIDGDIDLAKISSVLPAGTLPVADLRGQLVVAGRLGRDDASEAPEISLGVRTIGLVAAGSASGEGDTVGGARVETIARWQTSRVDVGLDLENDTASGLTGVAFRLADERGLVVAFDAKSVVPYGEIFGDPRVAKDRLLHAPVEAKLLVPRRALDHMPSVLRTDATGTVEAELVAEGTVLEPHVQLVAHGRSLRATEGAARSPSDVDLVLRYDGAGADLAVEVKSDGHKALALASHVDARVSDLVATAPRGKVPPWSASATIDADRFDLASLAQLNRLGIGGSISGKVALADLHRDAALGARLRFDALRVGRAIYRGATMAVDVARGELVAGARLDQSSGGFAEVSARTGVSWGADVVPSLVADRPIDARLVARSFRAAVIRPFVASVLDDVDGRIEADAKAAITPATKEARLEGRISLRDGNAVLTGLGQELRDARADVVLHPDGRVEVRDVFARSYDGEISAGGEAKLVGARLESASANVKIPERHKLNVTLGSDPLGQVWGQVKVKTKTEEGGALTTIDVDVPELGIELLHVAKAGLQSLEEKENFAIGTYRNGRTFVKLPIDREDYRSSKEREEEAHASPGSKLTVNVKLRRVEVERGNMAHAIVSGEPTIVVAGGKTIVNGQVHVDRGWVDVRGKEFDIQRAIVTFPGAADAEPQILATAAWTAADGTQVFADYVGPATSGTVTLRSEPPRPNNEILALILFGTADGASPAASSSGTSGATAAAGIGGGIAAQGLTDALDDLAGIRATARIDTTSSRNPRPEVEFQVSDRVSIQYAHVLGTPPITEPPDRNLVTLDWRFIRNWSLASTFGDRGRQLFDVLWQYRY